MRKRATAAIVAGVTALAMGMPAVGLANKGGHPHKTPPKCMTQKHFGKHKGALKGKKKGAGKGNKCGMPPVTPPK